MPKEYVTKEEARYGRWEWDRKREAYRCLSCQRHNADRTDFCPNCGAKMDGGQNEMKLSERFINTIDEDSIINGKNAHAIEDAVNFIRKYEDVEEQVRLVMLPCKVGDKFYRAIKETWGRPDRINEYICTGFYYANFDWQGLQIRAYETSDGISHDLKIDVLISASQFGKDTFLTWQEAKAALKGWQGDG